MTQLLRTVIGLSITQALNIERHVNSITEHYVIKDLFNNTFYNKLDLNLSVLHFVNEYFKFCRLVLLWLTF
jgi:hypothetical protein